MSTNSSGETLDPFESSTSIKSTSYSLQVSQFGWLRVVDSAGYGYKLSIRLVTSDCPIRLVIRWMTACHGVLVVD